MVPRPEPARHVAKASVADGAEVLDPSDKKRRKFLKIPFPSYDLLFMIAGSKGESERCHRKRVTDSHSPPQYGRRVFPVTDSTHFRRVTALGREIHNLHLARNKIFKADSRTSQDDGLPAA
jgi:hypothetical protein